MTDLWPILLCLSCLILLGLMWRAMLHAEPNENAGDEGADWGGETPNYNHNGAAE